MISIIRGSQKVLEHCPTIVSPVGFDHVYCLKFDPTFQLPWEGARRLLSFLRTSLSDSTVEKAIEPSQAILCLTLRGLVPKLSQDEQKMHAANSGLTLGFLPGTFLNPRPLIEAWAKLFASLIGDLKIAIVVPDITRIDSESLRVFWRLLQLLTLDERPHLIIGHDPNFQTIDWLHHRVTQFVEQIIALFEALPGTVVEAVSEEIHQSNLGSTYVADPTFVDPLDDDVERKAWKALTEESNLSDQARRKVGIQGMYAAFGAFGFSAALRLALKLLERYPQIVEAATIHAVAAISAHHLVTPFLVRDPNESYGLLEHHLAKALALETNPAHRVNFCQRLSILNARTKQDFNIALALANQTVDEAQHGNIPSEQQPYYEAWALNGRAFAFLRLGRLKEATLDCEMAHSLLVQEETNLTIPDAEVAFSRMTLLFNLVKLAKASGDHQQAHGWFCLAEKAIAELPADKRPYPLAREILPLWWYCRVSNDPEPVIAYFTTRLQDAQRQMNPRYEAVCTHYLGNLHYRLGNAKLAWEYFSTTLRVWYLIKDYPQNIITAELNCAVSAFRAGLLDESEACFQKLLHGPIGHTMSGQAEIVGALAMIAAKRSDRESVEQQAKAAVKQAIASKEQDVLVRVYRSIGDAFLILKNVNRAYRAFDKALTIARSDDSTIPDEDLLGVLVGWQICNDPDPELLVEALLLVPTALHDANAWWDVPQLLSHTIAQVEQGKFKEFWWKEVRLQKAAQKLIEAGLQRHDSKVAAEKFQRHIVLNLK